MSPAPRSSWQRIEAAFNAALDANPAEREAMIDAQCAGDPEMKREVASLLEAHARTGAVDRLALDVLAPALGQVHAPAGPDPGRAIGHYVVLDTLGVGGMGVVCRARDERLHRLVALKVLPPHLASDELSKRRFLHEARAAAALEHPNVCTVYEIGETADGQLFLAMPLYDGETLQSRLSRGPLPLDEALTVVREIASGLSAAHQSGIVHRDIKPSNIMLLADGRLKILDFGVAKVKDIAMTATGTPVGTVAYMSPEQTRGEPVDLRADIWALGVVLYEMLTGRRPFTGENAAAVAYAIVARQPDPASTLREHLPASLDHVIATALAKLPERRFATAPDMMSALSIGRPVERQTASAAGEAETRARSDAALTPSAERRRAAVLVTLISDYASLLEQLDPTELDETVALVRAAAIDAVRRHGGIVNQAVGEEIISVFGIPAAHEDDDLRAVRAALELHARARAMTTPAIARLQGGLAVQSGIHAGTIVAQRLREGPRRYAVSGAPVQLAARLGALAGRDHVLISGECERMVAPFVTTEAARPVEWQPDTAPIATHRVVGDSGVHARLEAGDRASRTPFTGRAEELSSLQALVRDARGGEGRLVLVVGEAGVGKSRMIHELREQISAGEMRVLVGRCRSYGGIAPYLPIVEVLRDLLSGGTSGGMASLPQTVQHIRALDTSLEPFIPLYLHLLSLPSDDFPLPRHLEGEHLHAALLDAISALLMASASRTPVLVLLEDWHWADDASSEVLLRLAEIVDSLPVAIIATVRPEGAVLAAFGGRATTVQLGPLDPSGTGVVMQALLGGQPISEDLVAQVHERTGGNPFFLEQVALTLREEGVIVAEHGMVVLNREIDSLRLPDTVQAVIRARLDRLDGDAREVLRVASVIGREFGRGLLAAAAPREIDCARALDRLRAATLIQQVRVVPEPTYRFKHVLTQEVAYGSLLEHQRKALHATIGAALEREARARVDEHADALAHHFSQAACWEQAVRYGRTAAERLRSLSQFANALAMCERLHEWLTRLPDDGARREAIADILLQQERLCETLGQRGRQQQIINELLALLAPHGASGRLAEAYLRQGDVLTLLKRFDAADRALNTVLRISRERQDAVLERNALRSIGLLRWHQDRHHEALALAEEALEIDRDLGDDLAVAGDLANIGNILRALGDYERARVVLEEAVAMPVLTDSPLQMSSVLHNLANVFRASGDLNQALAHLERADDAGRANMMPIQRSFHLTTIAHITLQQGRIEDAVGIYERAVELSRRARHAEGLAQGLRLLGELQFGLGRYAQAVQHLAESAALFGQLEDRVSEAQAWTQVAIGRERLGLWEEADGIWSTVRRLRQALADRAGELDALEGLGRAARQRGDLPAAASRCEDALTLAVSLGSSARQASLHNTLGILDWEQGRYNEALARYERGLRLCREAGDRPHEGVMLNSMGVTLARLHRHEEARTVLEDSVALNRSSGEWLLEAHALAALADVSVRLDRLETARDCLERAARIRRELGDGAAADALLQQLAGLPASRAGSSD
ncbi:MAG: tetratricopeptide repeat protein [Acidobacteria bacterium]|nr:tetratricopeptide repeat protein [Acidobacteriota bacterium]